MTTVSKMPSPALTVVVITRNRASILGDCLRYLSEQESRGDRYEVVVVDDGSTDDTPAVVKAYQERGGLPAIRYAAQPHGGVNAARNTGIKNARGEVIVFVDDDELTPATYLAQVEQLLASDSRFAGVGGPCRDHHKSGLRTCLQCSLASADIPGVGKRTVSYLLGGNMAIRSGSFARVGLFDESISGRGDENEWFHRAKGLIFFYDPDLWLWHRRDHLTLVGLCRHAYVQGLTVPRVMRATGKHYRPSLTRILRSLGHAAGRRCAKGLVTAFREMGATAGYLRLGLRRQGQAE